MLRNDMHSAHHPMGNDLISGYFSENILSQPEDEKNQLDLVHRFQRHTFHPLIGHLSSEPCTLFLALFLVECSVHSTYYLRRPEI